MTLPFPAAQSIFVDAPRADELPADYQPTEADLESIAAVNLDSFLPQNLPFADWLSEKSRQLSLLDDDRSQWLGGRVDELAKQAFFLGAKDPATFVDRDEAMLRPSGRRGYRRPWVGVSVSALAGIADWLQQSHPETAAALRRHLCVLERAAGGRR